MRQDFKNYLYILSIIFLFSLAACGSSPNNNPTVSGANVGISSVTNLPLPFDPVHSTSSASLSNMRENAADSGSNGKMLNSFQKSTFTSNSSLLSCQTTSQFLMALDTTSGGEVAYCAIKYAGDTIASSVKDLYSGNYTVFDIKFTQNGQVIPEASARVKGKVVRDGDNGPINSFTLFVCGNKHNPPDGTFKEFNYITMSIANNGNYSLTLKGSDGAGPDRSPNGWHLATINGNLQYSSNNAADNNTITGTFVGSKTIEVKSTRVDNIPYDLDANFIQSPTSLEYQGYTSRYDQNTNTTVQTHSLVDINNNAGSGSYDIGKLMLLNGGGIQWDHSVDNAHSSEIYNTHTTQSWDGSTLLPDSSAENFAGVAFSSLISGFSLPDIPSTPLSDTIVGFSPSESDDCTTTNTDIPSITVEVTPFLAFCQNSIQSDIDLWYSCYQNTAH